MTQSGLFYRHGSRHFGLRHIAELQTTKEKTGEAYGTLVTVFSTWNKYCHPESLAKLFRHTKCQ